MDDQFTLTSERLNVAQNLVTQAVFLLQRSYTTRECSLALDKHIAGLADALWKLRTEIVETESVLSAADGYKRNFEPQRLRALFDQYDITPCADFGAPEPEECPF